MNAVLEERCAGAGGLHRINEQEAQHEFVTESGAVSPGPLQGSWFAEPKPHRPWHISIVRYTTETLFYNRVYAKNMKDLKAQALAILAKKTGAEDGTR